jgi:hypothetical protein
LLSWRTCQVVENRRLDLTGPRLMSVGCADLWASDASDEGEDDRWKFDLAGHVALIRAMDVVCSVCCKRDRRVWWPRPMYNGSIRRGTSIYMCWPALGLYSQHFDILVSILSWANALTLLPTHLLAFDCDSWVRLSDSSALLIALHLEALEWLFCCGVSCYSWWLPPPRWLGAVVEVRHMLEIVRGRLQWLVCEGFLWFPGGAPNSNSSGLLVSLQLLAIVMWTGVLIFRKVLITLNLVESQHNSIWLLSNSVLNLAIVAPRLL